MRTGNMITLQCQLELSKQDKEMLLSLMRKFSSCMRYAYKRLLEGKDRKELKKELKVSSYAWCRDYVCSNTACWVWEQIEKAGYK
ncbi:transposase, putative, N-terminal domain-containing protein [Hydrogenobacter hydrogenophilus]|uniref:Transposase, putative, N-terminal domain-containing protein n=1 Tax=Hydrogenobacter hydrogenophilus TaxID=35835 RepID=A0A285P3U8_9AQUI|nr:transposase, putative, N-terminal domain-containing protein [Hydrogenobacter hydrogenophilus]